MRRAMVVGLVVLVAVVLVWRLARNRSPEGAPTATGSAAGRPTSGTRIVKPAATPASLSGRVTRRDGTEPIPGAVVAIVPTTAGPRMGLPAETPSTVVVTDGSGAWSVPAIAPGDYRATASAAGFLPRTSDKLAIAAGERKDHVDLALAAGGTTVSGTVTDVGGGAISGARVTMRPSGMRFARDTNEEVVALTGDDGTYKLTVPDGDWAATVAHDDYTRSGKWFRVAASPLVVDFVLAPGATIRGQVIAKDGTPVPGAEVTARSGRRWFGSYGRATADADGKFTLTGIDSGAISLVASTRGHASSNPTAITVGVGEQLDNVKIIVDHAFSISGTVVDAATRKGIAGVRVHAFVMTTGNAQTAEPTGADGAFEIPGVGRGSYRLSAMGDGVMPEFDKSTDVVDKDVTGIVIEMAAGVRLSGRVEPPVAASIRIEPDMDKIGLASAKNAAKAFSVGAESDPATGVFVLKNVPAGEFTLVATHADGRAGQLAVTVADQDRANLVVTLEARASIAGKVIDAAGAAVSDVRVTAEPTAPGASRRAVRTMRSGPRDGVVTGADGSFKIVGLDAGKLEMTMRDDQGKLAPARGDKLAVVELAAGQELTGLVLSVEARDGKITGRVLGADGKPAADAWVTATYQPDGKDELEARMARMFGSTPPALTTAEGRFVLDHLRRGSYQLVVDGPRAMSRAEATAKVGDDVAITLAALGALSGRVTAGGAPVKRYDLECRAAGASGFSFPGSGDAIDQHVSADDGSYSAERIVPGTYDCTITSDSGTVSDTVAIPSGPARHDFALAAFASVTGTVVDATTGKPLADLAVFNVQPNGRRPSSAARSGNGPKTDANGRFDLANQPPGDGRLMLMGDQKLLWPASGTPLTFTLTAGQRLDLGTIKVTEMPRPSRADTTSIRATPR